MSVKRMSPDPLRKFTGRVQLVVLSMLCLLVLAGCGPSAAAREAVDYTPLPTDDWEISTPEEQGLDPALVDELYLNATRVETIYSVLIIKNGYLIAEDYFNAGAVDEEHNLQSVTKSYMSALVGLALEQGCISSIDQPMMDFFPELADQIRDPRKNQITIREMLQMRAGYPWEESSPELTDLLFAGFRPSNLVDVPLAYDPGQGMAYSNLTSHLLGVLVARACDTDLKTFAQDHLLTPLGTEAGFWQQDWDGYYLGFAELHVTARDMAKFGQMYLDGGVYQGEQIVPAEWVHDSLQVYSEDAWPFRIGRNVQDMSYGYQWWTARAGDHHYNMAWGHGGQQIILLDDYDMVIVVTADPLYQQHGDRPWKLEKENLNLVGDFVASLPPSE